MGVPKFYRWISERYPKINEVITDSALLPEFSHLYLDMNGIIHGCTHPPELDVSEVLSERDMMLGIMHYLDRIITQIVKPTVSVYMAIDGVAPRAKLNQQRSRRFRSAKDMAEKAKDLSANGKDGPAAHNMFDSNCITPGTEFLAKVSEVIRYFIRKKLKEDPVWRNLTVIFSGHDIPGEGEHKIMEHIRQMRSQPNYEPNTRHCIYGQDADLIMLGLVTHEPHFTILREIVDFSFSRDNQNSLKQVKKFTKESNFQLLHLSILREYLEMEFCYRQPEYDLERCIDDFIFMTFLVGNDFLPHLPSLDIGDGAFDLLFSIYKDQRETWGRDNYLTEAGEIANPERLELFIMEIGKVETEILTQKEKDEAAYMKKRRKWDKRDGKPTGPSDAELQALEDGLQSDYLTMIEHMMAKYGNPVAGAESNFVEGWEPVTQPGEKDFKGRYYFEKLKLTPVDKQRHWELRKSYMEGLMWCLAYYYRGCISWGWFYPYHYGPMLSDLRRIPDMFEEIHFDLGTPLLPFQQLMGCLPPASCALVPKLYRWLMTSAESPIIQFYPVDFKVDMNGKRNPWEGVNLLPFIDVELLKTTITSHCPVVKLSVAEQKRNTFGEVYAYQYDASCTEKVHAPVENIGLIDIPVSHSSETIVDEGSAGSHCFEPRLIPGTKIPYPGFPSLNVLPIMHVEHCAIGVNCFGTHSKYQTLVLSLAQMPELPSLEVLAQNVLGQSLFVNWPMMHEAKVVAISDETQEIRLTKNQRKYKPHPEDMAERWRAETETMQQMYSVGNGTPGSGGVYIGDIRIRLKVLPLQGMKTNRSNGATRKLFGREEADVPLQLALWKAPAPDPRFVERGPLTIEERFPLGSTVVLTKGKYRGCKGSIVGVIDKKTLGVKVLTTPAEIPFGLAIARSVQETYVSSNDAARILKLNPGVLGKIAGRLQIEQGRYDLGLSLKSADGFCVVGYTRKRVDPHKKKKGNDSWSAGDTLLVVGSVRRAAEKEEERIQWEYSPKAIRLIESYRTKFPQLFSFLAKHPNEKKYDANLIFGPKYEEWLSHIREWLNNVESAKFPRSPVATQAMSHDAVAAVQKAADVRTLALRKKGFPKPVSVKIPGAALYREGSTGATDVLLASDLNNGESPELGDRVVNIAADAIPFGMRGTVVGIHEAATTGSVEVVMDGEFIGGTTLQRACSNLRGKLCLWTHLLKIAPENTKTMVEKLVPKATGKAAVEKIIKSIDPTAGAKVAKKTPTSIAIAKRNDNDLPSGPSIPPKYPQHEGLIRNVAIKPLEVQEIAVSTSRSMSSGRGFEGAWREARGPDDHGHGFGKLKRKGKAGLTRWREYVQQGRIAVQGSPAKSMQLAASETAEDTLKAVLGIGGGPSFNASVLTGSSHSTSDATSGLKAILGVGQIGVPAPVSETTSTTPPDDTAQLKAALGLTTVPTHIPGTGESSDHPAAESPPLLEAVSRSNEASGANLVEPPDPSQLPNPMAMLGSGAGSLPSAPPPSHVSSTHIQKPMVSLIPPSQAAPQNIPQAVGPPSAAETLLRMIGQKTASDPGQIIPPGAGEQRSVFNFTYVTEGQQPPTEIFAGLATTGRPFARHMMHPQASAPMSTVPVPLPPQLAFNGVHVRPLLPANVHPQDVSNYRPTHNPISSIHDNGPRPSS